MSFEIEIIEEKKNPLIDRTEVQFRIEHFGSGTPNRMDIKKKIAAMQNANEKLTIIAKIETRFGSTKDIGKANIYQSKDDLLYYEPFHIQVRNLPKEKRSEIYQLKAKKEPFSHLFDYE